MGAHIKSSEWSQSKVDKDANTLHRKQKLDYHMGGIIGKILTEVVMIMNV